MVPDTALSELVGNGLIHHICIALVTPGRCTPVALHHLKTTDLPVFHVHNAVVVDIYVVSVLPIAVVVPSDRVVIPYNGLCMIGRSAKSSKHVFPGFRGSGGKCV